MRKRGAVGAGLLRRQDHSQLAGRLAVPCSYASAGLAQQLLTQVLWALVAQLPCRRVSRRQQGIPHGVRRCGHRGVELLQASTHQAAHALLRPQQPGAVAAPQQRGGGGGVEGAGGGGSREGGAKLGHAQWGGSGAIHGLREGTCKTPAAPCSLQG